MNLEFSILITKVIAKAQENSNATISTIITIIDNLVAIRVHSSYFSQTVAVEDTYYLLSYRQWKIL